MEQRFCQEGQQYNLWSANKKLLLAVSGGLDSMVLLNLVMNAVKEAGCQIGVAHVNHQLRAESELEEEYLRGYCRKEQLPFYSVKWHEDENVSNIEAKARAFRYDFFAKIMKREGYTELLTAHHGDDQAETILMKLIRGSKLGNLSGIKSRKKFYSGYLVRPLLIFSKDELKTFAKQQNIVYFEDSSNHSDMYFRNRIRHQLIPFMKEENPKFLKQVASFSYQLQLADELIQETMAVKYRKWVKRTSTGWAIDLRELILESRSAQYFFLQTLLQQTLVQQEQVTLNHSQLEALHELIISQAPQKQISLEQGWCFIKEYQTAYLRKEEHDKRDTGNATYSLVPGMGEFLTEKEWLGFECVTEPLTVPERVQNWHEEILLLSKELAYPLQVRHRRSGDRIALTAVLNKRLNRLFIDKKIPNTFRENAWVILSANQEVIWVPQFVNSYLSIPEETDKIHYRLLYRIKE